MTAMFFNRWIQINPKDFNEGIHLIIEYCFTIVILYKPFKMRPHRKKKWSLKDLYTQATFSASARKSLDQVVERLFLSRQIPHFPQDIDKKYSRQIPPFPQDIEKEFSRLSRSHQKRLQPRNDLCYFSQFLGFCTSPQPEIKEKCNFKRHSKTIFRVLYLFINLSTPAFSY